MFKNFLALALIFLGLVIAFWGPFFSQNVFSGDYSVQNVEASKNEPFFGGIIFSPSGLAGLRTLSSNAYLPAWLFHFFLPPNLAVNLRFLVNIFLAAVFMFITLSRLKFNFFGSLIGGLTYGFCGTFASLVFSGNINKMDAFVWQPLVFLFVYQLLNEKRFFWAAGAGFFLGLMLLSNEPQASYYFFILLSFLVLGHLFFKKENPGQKLKIIFLGFLALFLALLLSANSIFSYLDLNKNLKPLFSETPEEVWRFKTEYSLPPEEILIFPFTSRFFGGLSGEGYWGKVPLRIHDDYLGMVALIFVALAFLVLRRRLFYFFAGAFVFSVFIALGKYNPIYQFFYQLPLMNIGRNPIRWLLPGAFFWAGLAGFGADALGRLDKKNWEKFFFLLLVILTVFLGFLILVSLEKAGFLTLISQIWPAGLPTAVKFFRLNLIWQASLRALVFLTLGAGLIYGIYRAADKKNANYFLMGILLLLVFDFSLNLRRFIRYYDHQELYKENEIIRVLKNDPDFYRVKLFLFNKSLYEITSYLQHHQIFCTDGIISTIPREYQEFFQKLKNNRLGWLLFNIKYALSDRKVTSDELTEKLAACGFHLYQLKNFLPRVFWVNQVKKAKNTEEIFDYLNQRNFNPQQETVIEAKFLNENVLKSLSNRAKKTAPPKILSYSGQKIEIDVSSSPGSFLYLADVYDPYWRAFLDGRPAQVIPANYLFRVIWVPEAAKKLVLRYEPPKIGKYLTFGAWLFFGGLGLYQLVTFFKRKK